MAFENTSYVSKIGLPGVLGSLSIAHSTLTSCGSGAGDSLKACEAWINGFTARGEYFDGLTINVFFSEPNTVFNDALRLKLTQDPNDNGIPIIHSMLYAGSGVDDNAIFLYPRQNKNSIITFVYRELDCQYNNIHYGDGAVNYYHVQEAINAYPVQSVIVNDQHSEPNNKLNFDNQVNTATVEIYNLSTMQNTMVEVGNNIGGILEVIPMRDSLLIQRVTTNLGDVYQRERYENPNLTPVEQQSNQVKMATSTELSNMWTKNELANPINPPSPIVFAEAMPPIPAQGSSDVRYNLEVWASPPVQDPETGLQTTGGYGFHFQPIT